MLLDNQRLGMVRQWQSLFFNARHSSTILDDNPDFVVLASAFGIKGERIDSAHQVDAALKRLFNSQEAYLLHICIHSDENVWPASATGRVQRRYVGKYGVITWNTKSTSPPNTAPKY